MDNETLRLIEDFIPLDIISDHASREKGQRTGNLASLHIWWGRKPQIASRAAVYAALVPAPHDQTQREAYVQMLISLCNTTVPASTLTRARRQIAEVHIADLFAGGGSIPLEALRLGCRVLSSDLNPVAYLLERCTIDYPQQYPDIAHLVTTWGKRLLDQVRDAVTDLYSPFSASNPHPPDAHLWSRIVVCPNPNCGAVVPLAQNTWLANRSRRAIALRVVPRDDGKGVAFILVQSHSPEAFDFAVEGLSSRGNACCFCCGSTVESSYVKAEGKAGRLGTQLMAVTSKPPGARVREYRAAANLPGTFVPDATYLAARIDRLCTTIGITIPDEPIFCGDSRAFFTHLYGLERFGDLFTPRQIVVLLTTIQHIHETHTQMIQDGIEPDKARAVATYLALLADRLANWNSSVCRWVSSSESVSDTFSRQAIPMAWNFAEIYPFGKGSGNLYDTLNRMGETINLLAHIPAPAQVARGPAHQSPLADESVDAIVTDPPYYDNIPYADLSDFFYVWLKRSIGTLYPEHFAGHLTPKKWEAIADPSRHSGNCQAANTFYRGVIQRSLEEAHRVLKPAAPLVIVYAHKTTAGWSSLVEALRSAGFVITEAWPINTESRGRMRAQNSAALASSIFIVARKRSGTITGSYVQDVLPELKRRVRERVVTLSNAGISGADLVIACVGAGLRAYTQFARVELPNGEELAASTFLDEVQRAVMEVILTDVIGLAESGVNTVDKASQYYILARFQYGSAVVDFDEANVLARGVGVELDGPKALTSGSAPLVRKTKTKVEWSDYRARGAAERLGLPNDGSAPPLIDVLHRLLWLNDQQPSKVAQFLGEARPDPDRLRMVAEALGGKGLSSEPSPGAMHDERTEEQKAIGRLLPAWRRVVEEQTQGRMF